MTIYFSHDEAAAKLGRIVKAAVDFIDVPKRTTGIVVGVSPAREKWRYNVMIKWDGVDLSDEYSKRDYEAFLEEVPVDVE